MPEAQIGKVPYKDPSAIQFYPVDPVPPPIIYENMCIAKQIICVQTGLVDMLHLSCLFLCL